MTIDEFRNAFRNLLNDAAEDGIDVDELLAAVDEELHPPFEHDTL